MLLLPGSAFGADDPAGIDFFETKIRPVLVEKCYGCHSVDAEGRKKLKGGLYLDSKEGMLKGGKEGVVLLPGNVEKSRLIEAVRYVDDNTAMPPKEKLSATAIADIEAWVKMGAPDPRFGDKAPKPGGAIAEKAKTHWSFQPVVAIEPPAVTKTAWVKTEIDRFVLAKLEAAKLVPAAPADKRTLLRRATFDLTGLPTSADEVSAFENDTAPDAFTKAVDRLLASPAYGERWGRHWLDVARYADTKGYVFQEDRSYPYAYTYRDWVVQSFNDDMPYDRFIQMQIAGDRLAGEAGEDKKHLAAMGFLTVGRRFINNAQDIIDDRLDVISRGTMGMTIACARCHDHKFDPIPTKDYYSLYGVFASSEEPKELPIIGSASDPKEALAFDTELSKRQKDVEDFRSTRFAERVTQIRGAEQLAAYLRAGQDAHGKSAAELKDIAANRKLEAPIVQRWKDWLEKQDSKHSVFGPWKILAEVAENEFAAKAKELLSSPTPGLVNPFMREALEGKTPNNREELAKLYAGVIAANDNAHAHADSNQEALRQVLRGDGTPTAVAYERANDVLNGDDENKTRELQKKVDELASQHAGAPPRAMVLSDRKDPNNVRVLIRGQVGNQGEEAPRRFLSFIAGKDAKPFSDGSGRAELARAITSKDNPLTARVIVNRIWTWHFGNGLVRTPSDFGMRSEAPVHRELLDWLAVKLVSDGWSVKKLHRLIMSSAVYQQSAEVSDEAKRNDSENLLWSHANRQRLDFESMRDALLSVSGKLDQATGGRPVDLAKLPFSNRRTLYGIIDRQNLPGMFRNFDFASPDTHTALRFQTTVPQQALFLMNGPFAVEQARALAKRTEIETLPEQRVRTLYRFAFARTPGPGEIKQGLDFLHAMETAPAEEKSMPIWKSGYGLFDENTLTFSGFAELPKFKDGAWRGGDKMPDEKLAYLSLTANGGHPGNNHQHAVVRRWTAPVSGTFAINGKLTRPSKDGDGIRALVIPQDQAAIGNWILPTESVDTIVPKVTLKAGQWLDFVIDCRGNSNSDSFSWALEVAAIEGATGQWRASDGFAEPKGVLKPLSPWERYSHTLLMTNEFDFVD